MNQRRLADLAFLIPWIGAFLLTPPMIVILQAWSKAAGFPLHIVYIFVCWLALIVAGRVVTARLAWRDDALPPQDRPILRERGDG